MRSRNEEFAKGADHAMERLMPMPSRKTAPLAVAIRRQTPEEQRQFHAALDVFLAEWVRQHLGPQRQSK